MRATLLPTTFGVEIFLSTRVDAIWESNFTRGMPPPGFFFHEEAVAHVGSITSVFDVMEKLPFDRLQDTLTMFNMTSGSAEVVGDTLCGCQERLLIPGEQKACATSLEGTMQAATCMLAGVSATRRGLRHTLLDLLGEALNEVLGLLECEAGERVHRLDGRDTRAARYLIHDDDELRLLGRCRLLHARTWHRDCRGDAEALLQVVNEVAGFLECQPNDGVPELHDLGGLGGGGCEADGEEEG
jgi:hypothetical protein